VTWEQTVTIASKIGIFAGWDGERQAAFARQLAVSSIGVVAHEVIAGTVDRMLEETPPEKLSLPKLVEMVKTRPVVPRRVFLPAPEDSSGRAERRFYFPRDNGKEPFPVAHPDEQERERMRRYYAEKAVHPEALACRRDLGITREHLEAARERREDELARHEENIATLEEQAELSQEDRAALKRAQSRLEQLRAQTANERKAPTKLRGQLERTLAGLGAQMGLVCVRCGSVLDGESLKAYTLACMDAGSAGREQPERRCLGCTEWRAEQGVEARECPPF
jgi:hypothetical protein